MKKITSKIETFEGAAATGIRMMARTKTIAALCLALGCGSSGSDDAASLSGDSNADGETGTPTGGSADADDDSGSSASEDGDTSGGTDGETDGETDGDPGDPPADGWPIGIPHPDFGEVETVQSIHGDAGFSTHYVDNTVACDDAEPGTAGTPRCSIPLDGLSAGDVVFVAAGTYAIGDTSFSWSGTAGQPIFLRGPDDGPRPIVTHAGSGELKFDFTASYAIIENLEFAEARIRPGGDHVALRNVRVHGSEHTGVSFGGTDMMVMGSEIDHHQVTNRLGVNAGCGSQRLWVIGNHIHHNAEDSVQFGHGCQANPIQYGYIGGNHMHSDRENAVDFKWVRHIIVSQNSMHSYVQASVDEEFCYDDGSRCDPPGYHSSGSDGSVGVIGSDGVSEDVWIILNDISDAPGGIRNEESTVATIYGNVIYDVGRAVMLDKQGNDVYVVNNVVYDAVIGVDQYWREDFRLHIVNNIFENVGTPVKLESGTVAGVSQMRNNLFWSGGSAMSFEWGNQYQVSGDGDFAGMGANVSGNLVGDPMFTDAAAADFEVPAASPAVDAGTDAVADDRISTYATEYGEPIGYDFAGAARPTSTWDIGAFEQ